MHGQQNIKIRTAYILMGFSLDCKKKSQNRRLLVANGDTTLSTAN